jgi:hypothetical protein
LEKTNASKTSRKLWENLLKLGDSSYWLFFYLGKKDEIYHYSSKEHPKFSKSAKFGCKML